MDSRDRSWMVFVLIKYVVLLNAVFHADVCVSRLCIVCVWGCRFLSHSISLSLSPSLSVSLFTPSCIL